MDTLLTVPQVAEKLNCHKQTVYRNKELPRVEIPGVGVRYRESDLLEYVEKRTIKPTQEISHLADNKIISLISPPASGSILSGGNSGMAKAKSKTRYNLGYGAIYQRKTKNGMIRWYIDYRDEFGTRVQRVVSNARSREEAMIALQAEIANIFAREHNLKVKSKRIRLSTFIDDFVEDYSRGNKISWKDDRYRLNKFKSFAGNIYLDELNPQDVERFKKLKLKEGLSKTTINHYLKVLKRMYNVAVEWGKIKRSLISGVKLLQEGDTTKERLLTYEEEDRLLNAAARHLKPILIVALNTGMRQGEILRMKWDHIDLAKQEIRIERTKSGKPRTVDINTTLKELLIQLERQRSSNPYIFANPKTGKPYTKPQRSFEGARSMAGIEDLRFHDLRHTFASRLIAAGVDIIKVKEILGHSTVRITERYLHSDRTERKKAVELLCRKRIVGSQTGDDLLRICDTGES